MDFFSFQDKVQFISELYNCMKEQKNTILSENKKQQTLYQ